MMKRTVCLNMIVKNEKHVIERSLGSVKHLIDYWVIVDTGSTDGTEDTIKEFLKDIPGELHERSWKNFGHNRNEAMILAKDKGDYLLFIDADDRLVYMPGFLLPPLEADLYTVVQKEQMVETFKEHQVFTLVKNSGEFEWEGVIHEYLKSNNPRPKSIQLLTNVFNEYIADGGRSRDPDKHLKDVRILTQGILDHPEKPRNYLYLANTYYSYKEYAAAMHYYQQRALMGDCPMEVYYSLLYFAICQRQLKYPPEIYLQSFAQAHLYRPSRVESIYEIIRHYVVQQQYLIAYALSKIAVSIPVSKDSLFVESWVSDWGVPLYHFICAGHIGQFDEARLLLQGLLSNTRLPENIREEYQLESWHEFLSKQATNF